MKFRFQENRSVVLFLCCFGFFRLAVAGALEGGQTPAIQARERVAGHERAVQVLPELDVLRGFSPVQVPAGHYFFFGDNRGHMADSRFIGMVPRWERTLEWIECC